MNRVEFLEQIKELLEYESQEDLTFSTRLTDLDEWDSISIISVVAFLNNEFGQKVSVAELQNIETVEDIAKLVGI